MDKQARADLQTATLLLSGFDGRLQQMVEYAIRDAWTAKDWRQMIDLCNQYRELRNTL